MRIFLDTATLRKIAKLVDGPISAETISMNAAGMVEEARCWSLFLTVTSLNANLELYRRLHVSFRR